MMNHPSSDSEPALPRPELPTAGRAGRARWIAGILGSSLLGSSTFLFFPSSAEAAIPPELPFTARRGVGARAMGMAGAYSAVANDYHALYYNPAGLTRLRDTEFGLVFDKRSADSNNGYLGNEESTGSDNTNLESIGFVYPYPTYRGALAFGISYERISSFDLDYFRSAENEGEIVFEDESIEEDGSLGAYQAGFAWELSPAVALGVTGTILAGSSDRRRTFDFEASNGDFERTLTETMTDLTAITGSVGILYRLGKQVDLGLVVRLPENLDLDGTIHDDVQRSEQISPDSSEVLDYIDDFNFADDLSLPYRVTGAVAYSVAGLLVSGEATFTDWKEIDYFGEIRDDDRNFAYRSTTDLRIGAEYAIPEQPIRLRAGFASQPVPYDLIAVDVFRGRTSRASFDHDFRFFTLGAGLELDESLVLDAAYMTGSFLRRGSVDDRITEEEIEEQRILVGATFRVKS